MTTGLQISPVPHDAEPDAFSPASLLDWLAERYEPVSGGFIGRGPDAVVSPGLLAAQGRAILAELGLLPLLPHVIRLKFDHWPECSPAELAAPALGSPLAAHLDAFQREAGENLREALAAFRSSDGGLSLASPAGEHGQMAAVHLLLTGFPPGWFLGRGVPFPRPLRDQARRFAERVFHLRLA